MTTIQLFIFIQQENKLMTTGELSRLLKKEAPQEQKILNRSQKILRKSYRFLFIEELQ